MNGLNKPPNRTRDYFQRISKVIYLMGAQDYWCEDLNLPSAVKLFHFCFMNFVNVASVALILSQWAVYFTDQKLTAKQSFDSKLFALAHPLSLGTVLITEKSRKKVSQLLQKLTIDLKEVHNDESVETAMMKKSKFVLKCYSTMIFMTAFLFGLEGFMMVKRGHTFVTMVTAWPDFEDTSTTASASRVIIYIVWCFLLIRLTSVFIMVIPLSICLSHQYKNLCSYFIKLNDIFKEDCSQEEKEIKYEKAFKVGIQLHSETMVCAHQLQELFGAVYGGQIIIKSTSVMAMMSSMANAERTLSHVVSTIGTASYSLISLGYLICYAGYTTVEAASLPSAIFFSGWQNCTKKTNTRIRPLVVIALLMSQRPVVLKCLGSVTLSFSSYVTIVKSCYSGFSVLY
nr:odorant receptor 27 [Phthorimaea operculella]